MGILTVVDGHQIERYAVYYVRWRACEAFLAQKDQENAKFGFVPPGCYPMFSTDTDTYAVPASKPGGPEIAGYVKYPALDESHRLDKALKQIEQQFGLTPAARVRLVGLDDGEDAPGADPFTTFMSAGRRHA
jgi:P27 family predicted phage terminase small subunit